ncbi:MAG: hypothetical protein DHS20C15_27990 [Planctomycetota bacterium]|nr:MAG: hypothetical protein DHS20C15_27990 [Planctomycetota bacterium]
MRKTIVHSVARCLAARVHTVPVSFDRVVARGIVARSLTAWVAFAAPLAAATQEGVAAESAWELSPQRHVTAFGELGAWLLGALTLLLITKAVLRRDRYRAVTVLSDADRERVRAAIAAAELRTTGEIVPVVVERSDPHPAADWKCALTALLLGSALLATWLPWESPFALLACQLGFGALGYVLARALPDLKRLFVLETRATATAEEQALQEFARQGLQSTEAATGVLIFVSLFERRVVVLADKGIAAKVDASAWEALDEHVLDGVVKGELAAGLCQAITEAGTLLEEHFPWTDGDRNELPDHLVVRRE